MALNDERAARAAAITAAGGIDEAIGAALLPRTVDVTLSEATVLGLVKQGVRKFVVTLGHGTTDLGEVLRVYEAAGVVRSFAVRNEIEGAHAATALRWIRDEKAAVVTSIGPGALQAMAASLAAASDGIGVWHVYADETTEAEGPNMQQIPGQGQEQFLKLTSVMGGAFTLHTPRALPEALRRGQRVVDDPHRGGPFFLLLPINTQPALIEGLNLDSLPALPPPPLPAARDDGRYEEAARALLGSSRVVVKLGGGSRRLGPELAELLELTDAVAVTGPSVSGVLPEGHPRNMTVGGSKGSISGNFAMEQAEVLIAVGTRGVCQSDMSRTGYPRVTRVININTDAADVVHYNHTIPFHGEASATIQRLNEVLRAAGAGPAAEPSNWFRACRAARADWDAYRAKRYANPTLFDAVWNREVLTQPAAVHHVATWARERGFVSIFDAGDVQANGFQVVEDEVVGTTFTETGASYMGFASSAVLATALAERPFRAVAFTGDGSFTMNPQILIDGVQHGARGTVVLFDNRRQGAISSLQHAQYGVDYATNDAVEVDYVAWADAVTGVLGLHGGHTLEELSAALARAAAHDGLSLVHVPVYFGEDELGGLGSFGRWNVGPWVEATQDLLHESGI